jgi:type IV secretion system protein VirD4
MKRNLLLKVVPIVVCLLGIAIIISIDPKKPGPHDSKTFLMGLGLTLGAGLFLFISAGKSKSDSTSHGSAQWAQEKDIKRFIVSADDPPAPGALILGKPVGNAGKKRFDIPRDIVIKHTIVLGPTGSGKSRGFFLWQQQNYDGSFITTDPKSEAWNNTSGARERALRFAPREPDNSEPFNFVPTCGQDSILCDQPFWVEAGTAFLASLFAHASTFENPTPAAAYDFLTSTHKDFITQVLLNSPNKHARQFAANFSKANEKLQGDIIIGAANLINWLSDEKVRRFTSSTRKTADFGWLRKEKISVYWCLNESDVESLKPLSTLFFTLALYQIKQAEGTIPVCLFLDECANVGRIPALQKEITILRGRDIALVLGLQSLSQLEEVYGKDAARVIRDNACTLIALAGLKLEAAEYISKSLGNETRVEPQTSKTKRSFWESTVTESERSFPRPLLTPSEVREMRDDQQIVISDNFRPMINERFWFKGGCEPALSNCLGEVLTQHFEQQQEEVKKKKTKG